MNIIKKIGVYLFLTIFVSTFIVAKNKITGLAALLFPLPVACFNAGCHTDALIKIKHRGSFFEVLSPGSIHINFSDVAGLDGVKEDMQDIISFLQNPAKFKKMGAHIPQGILMNGAPGTGKTLLAKALAGQADCSFIYVNGSDFCNSSYMGIGSQKISELFKVARDCAPCIIFIDEIDSVGAKRSAGFSGSGMLDHNNTLTTLLAEMDGFASHEKSVIVIAATNKVELLDPAMKRPGRFDRIVEVTKPYVQDRAQLLRIAFAKCPISDDINIDLIAQITRGFSGAQIAHLVNEAAIVAVKNDSETIDMCHVETAYDIITLGREVKGMNQSDDALWQTAIHEAGHLIAYLFQETNYAVHKVSIIPRTKSLGVACMLPLKEAYAVTKEDMTNRIVTLLAGREAQLAFGFDLDSGASSDLQRAQEIAYDMVAVYGMADGMRNFSSEMHGQELPHDVSSKIYHEVECIMDRCQKIVRQLIADHHDDIKKIADLLMCKRTVLGDEIYALLDLKVPGMFFVDKS